MKKALLLVLMMGGLAQANAQSTIAYANVLSSTPVYERSVSTHCDSYPVTRIDAPTDNDRVGGSIVGGIVGGVLGHQIGKGHGRDVATVAGAIAGTMTGRNLADRPSVTTDVRQECHDERRDRIAGYSVEYEYKGIVGTTQLDYDPGSRIEVEVQVTPRRRY